MFAVRRTSEGGARADAPGAILVDRELRALIGSKAGVGSEAGVGNQAGGHALAPAPGAPPIEARQVQPASVDLRLSAVAWRIRAGFLPERVPVEERLRELSTSRLSLEGEGGVLERGLAYLV